MRGRLLVAFITRASASDVADSKRQAHLRGVLAKTGVFAIV